MIGLLADRAPGLLRGLHEADPDYALIDGPPAECDRSGDARADYVSTAGQGRARSSRVGAVGQHRDALAFADPPTRG